jgi:hypothetical protein
MPVEPRSADTFSKGNLLLGFSQVEFQPRDAVTGQLGVAVPIGILSGQELAKEITTLELPDGSAGTITVAREILSSLKPSFQLDTFNFRSDIAQYIFGAATVTAVVSDAAAAISNEPIALLGNDTFDGYISLNNGEINEASIEVTCATVTDESVGTGDGTSGDASGDFQLIYKVKAVADVTALTVAGVTYTPIAVGAASSGFEVEVVVGESDTLSGDLQFHSGGSVANVTGAIVATYTPSFSTTGGDIINATTDAGVKSSSDTVAFTEPGGANDLATRTVGSWLTEGFLVGMQVHFEGTVSNDGIVGGRILALSALVMEFAEGDLTAEGAVATTAVGWTDGGDFILDPLIGRIRFLHAAADLSPFRLAAASASQALEIDYTYSQNSGVEMQPFTQGGGSFDGQVTIKHLPDVGVNFIWVVPSATIHLTDDSLTFGSDDFAVGALEVILNDSGGSVRFGTMTLSSEAESA